MSRLAFQGAPRTADIWRYPPLAVAPIMTLDPNPLDALDRNRPQNVPRACLPA